jgi:hypothetical protein
MPGRHPRRSQSDGGDSRERRLLNARPFDIRQLWTAVEDQPTLVLPITTFRASLAAKLWEIEDGSYVSPNEVLADLTVAPWHARAISRVDLRYPIIIADSNHDVLDGLHRLCRSVQLGKTTIRAQTVSLAALQTAGFANPSAEGVDA